MAETEFDSLEYLSRAFKGLSDEKQDYVLKTAKSLLEVQGIPVLCLPKKPFSKVKDRKSFKRFG
jgi:hypothetical protein